MTELRHSSVMRTLFSENILSPSPQPTPSSKPDDWGLSFRSRSTTAFTASYSSPTTTAASSAASQASTPSSPRQDKSLTYRDQNRRERPTEHDAHEASSDAAVRYGGLGRKGHPKLIFMGMRRSGKSSIQKVIFDKFSPAETLYLDPTTRIEMAVMHSFMKFESAELPFNLPILSPDFEHNSVFGTAGAVIWVIDMQDEYFHSINQLIQNACFLLEHYPRLHFEVFIHKADGLSAEYKDDTFRDVRQRVQDELSDAGLASLAVAFHLTSIFDHSVYESMSKVIQKLLPQLPAVEALLTKLCATCRIQKAYLFDTLSKLYLATDASPTFLKDYEVCSDYVDVVVDIKQIYGWQNQSSSQTDHDSRDDAVGESLISFDKSGNTYIYAREINDYLSLICVMGQDSTADKRVLIDYNVSILSDALIKMFKI